MIFLPEILQKLRLAFLQLRTITNPNRYFIFNIIEQNEPINVTDIANISNMDQPIVSQLISVLRKSNFVTAKQENKKVYYTHNKQEVQSIIHFSIRLLGTTNTDAHLELKENYANVHQAYKILKILLHPGRLSLLEILGKKEEISVNEMVEISKMKQSISSQNLSILKELNFVNLRKEGKHSYYSLNRETIRKLKESLR
jgi:ArsR family transcriptional regulator, arsenate/arsenite/antimonite-responsive transcriptional repressor